MTVPPNPGIYECCGRRVHDGHPRLCGPQVANLLVLALFVVGVMVMAILAAT